ncbi:DUF1990 family protein, partial [Mycobacterium rufum]|nr:DUF1990 family protein [Mycolicibacterium rufum]
MRSPWASGRCGLVSADITFRPRWRRAGSAGASVIRRSRRRAFRRRREDGMRFGMLRGAGVRVEATTPTAEVGTDVLGHLGPVPAPCRV